MRRQSGFTLIEIIVVIAILGILGATAIPTYHTWHHRAIGSEAKIMVKQILDAEITYFLDNNKFFPNNDTYIIYSDGGIEPSGVDVSNLLKVDLGVDIPTGHLLDFTLVGNNTEGSESFQLIINSSGDGFEIFAGATGVSATLDKAGQIEYMYF